jgi:hypothetical protein
MDTEHDSPARRGGSGWSTRAALLRVAIVVGVATTLWIAHTWLFPQPFAPVVLDAREQAVLDTKMLSLAGPATIPAPASAAPGTTTPAAQPAPYVERPEDRVIHFTQRELNALVARNPELAGRLALHLSDDLLSATMLITLPADLPVFAGRSVRVATGLRLRYGQGRPVVAIEGVSIMGVPLPAAWLGGIKGQDLVALHGGAGGFWQAFGEGVRELRIEDGRLRVELAE